MSALARAAGYGSYQPANRQYGRLAGKLAEVPGYDFQGGVQTGLFGTFNNGKDPDEPWRLTMHPELARALEILGWTEANLGTVPPLQGFEAALVDFVQSYATLSTGQSHLQRYPLERRQGLENYREVLAANQRGEDITDLVLAKLLPHHDTQYNRERGAWIHQVEAITRDIKPWFENGKGKTPDQWPTLDRSGRRIQWQELQSSQSIPPRRSLPCLKRCSSKNSSVNTLSSGTAARFPNNRPRTRSPHWPL